MMRADMADYFARLRAAQAAAAQWPAVATVAGPPPAPAPPATGPISNNGLKEKRQK